MSKRHRKSKQAPSVNEAMANLDREIASANREMRLIGWMCGPILLLVGVAGLGVALFDPPSSSGEHTAATVVGLMGLTFGVGFLSTLFPAHWGLPGKLWRYAGWLLPAVLLAFAAFTFSDPVGISDRTTGTRGRTPLSVVIYGLGSLVMAGALGRAWWTSRKH